MNLRGNFIRSNFRTVAATALLAAVGITPAFAQQGVVSDWSNHHVKFTNPGSEMDALMNGHRQQYQGFVNDARFRAQQFKHSAAVTNRAMPSLSAFSESRNNFSESRNNREPNSGNSSMQGLWTSKLGPVGDGTVQDTFPAEYDASFSSPSCTGDYVVFPVNATGSTTQANLVVYNHLYVNSTSTGFCPGATTPTTFAGYYVYLSETGTNVLHVEGSPVISEDGTQVAFVVNDSTYDYLRLYVLTLGAGGGTEAAPKELTTTSNANSLTYTVVQLAGGSDQGLTSPWVDYTTNTAYVASTGGKVYKVQNVFKITGSTPAPTEVTTTPWPITVASGDALTAPVVDPATSDIIVGASNGDLYCVTSAGASCGAGSKGSFVVSTAAGLTGGTAGAVVSAPIVVDNGATTGTTGWVFAQASYTVATTTGTHGSVSDAYAVLAQAPITTTGLGTAVGVNMGTVSVTATGTSARPTITLNSPALYDGAFDNTYYNSTVSNYVGNLYFCGNESVTYNRPGTSNTALTYDVTPELYRIGFASSGALTGTATALYTPAANTTAEVSGCTPLTEFYNANANSGAGADYLFLGVSGYGAPTGCAGDGCVMNFTLPSTGGSSILPSYSYSLGGNGDGSSGFVIDNQSTDVGASQIYFSNLQTGNATAASQAGLN